MPYSVKRVLNAVFIILLVLGLAACGQSDKNNTSKAESSPASSGSPAASSASPSASPSASQAAQEDTAIRVEDALGTVELPRAPERIVAMEFGFTDALVTLGVQPVGVADDGDPNLFMDAVRNQLTNYQSVGSRYEPNIELISSLQPDLIIVDLNKHKEAFPQLKSIAPLLVLDDFQADYEQMLKNYGIIAKTVGREEEGAKRLEQHAAYIEDAKRRIKSSDLTVLPAVVNPNGFFAHSDHSYSGSFLASLGFEDPVKDEASYPQLTLEQLTETNPGALFLMPTEEVTIVDEWKKNPLWNKLDAVASERVFTVERRDWSLARGLIGSEKMIEDIANALGE